MILEYFCDLYCEIKNFFNFDDSLFFFFSLCMLPLSGWVAWAGLQGLDWLALAGPWLALEKLIKP